MRFYGLDLRERLEVDGCRRLWTLAQQLPRDAATVDAMAGDRQPAAPVSSRPVDELAERRERKVETDPDKIAQFFGATFGGTVKKGGGG